MISCSRKTAMKARVIIERQHLDGYEDGNSLQRFATLYFGRKEYQVYAPARARGQDLAWLENCFVRTSDGYDKFDVPQERSWILQAVQRELESEMQTITKDSAIMTEIDTRKVFVVHGRNMKAREAVFTFLRALDLAPMEWEEVVALTGKANPYIGEALEIGFAAAQAAVVIMTGDDVARVGKRYLLPHDPHEEKVLTPQSRPNVLFEAGMALGKYPNRTLILSIGTYRKFSDIDGRHVVHLSNKPSSRQALADRLIAIGCAVKKDNRVDWHTAGDFDGAVEDADLPVGKETIRLKTFSREYKFAATADFKRKVWIQFLNETDECLTVRSARWKSLPSGIHLTIRPGTFQLQLGNTWCPENIGVAELKLPPGEFCRLWAAPDDSTTDDEIKKLCISDAPFGFVTLFVNSEEIAIPV